MVSSSHAASLYCALVFASLLMLLSSSLAEVGGTDAVKGAQILERPCDEIYVVGEGETLHTIGAKCGDPFIVERNPHVHDPDDVFPGLVLKIAPSLRCELVSTIKGRVVEAFSRDIQWGVYFQQKPGLLLGVIADGTITLSGCLGSPYFLPSSSVSPPLQLLV